MLAARVRRLLFNKNTCPVDDDVLPFVAASMHSAYARDLAAREGGIVSPIDFILADQVPSYAAWFVDEPDRVTRYARMIRGVVQNDRRIHITSAAMSLCPDAVRLALCGTQDMVHEYSEDAAEDLARPMHAFDEVVVEDSETLTPLDAFDALRDWLSANAPRRVTVRLGDAPRLGSGFLAVLLRDADHVTLERRRPEGACATASRMLHDVQLSVLQHATAARSVCLDEFSHDICRRVGAMPRVRHLAWNATAGPLSAIFAPHLRSVHVGSAVRVDEWLVLNRLRVERMSCACVHEFPDAMCDAIKHLEYAMAEGADAHVPWSALPRGIVSVDVRTDVMAPGEILEGLDAAPMQSFLELRSVTFRMRMPFYDLERSLLPIVQNAAPMLARVHMSRDAKNVFCVRMQSDDGASVG